MFAKLRNALEFVTAGSVLRTLLGCLILTFGVYNIHSLSGVTEGGVLGLMLLFDNLFGLSPAWTSLILNGLCYLLGWRTLGKKFLVNSAIAAVGYSIFYAVFECFPPVYPQIAEYPLAASILGAVFVGIGAGICVREESAPSGDDALALSLSKLTGAGIQWIYLISDLTVLTLSLTYIPLTRILYSLLTVVLSGQIIGWIQKIK
ncbi:MAG: YitT family protein [Clostridia bacterium]|nr:YitT family protein [Clostridia bacterium]